MNTFTPTLLVLLLSFVGLHAQTEQKNPFRIVGRIADLRPEFLLQKSGQMPGGNPKGTREIDFD